MIIKYINFATYNLSDRVVHFDPSGSSEDECNRFGNAVYMVYDPKVDGEEALAQVSARVDPLGSGITADGKVNIRNATSPEVLAGLIK